jgi:DNA-binding HxlR family transcriptional regulator
MASERRVHHIFDLLGTRWNLRIVWEVRRSTLTFSEIRRRLGISPSVLTDRLDELIAARILERDASRRYRLSGRGRELAQILFELNRWAERAGVSSRSELD